MRYLARFLDASDPSASLKHACYALVVCFYCGWLTYALVAHGLDGNWVAAAGILVAAVTTSKIVGSGPSPAPTTGAVPSTVVEATSAPGSVVPETFPTGGAK